MRSQRGTAMAEFVIGAPILLLLLYAVVELGRALVQFSLLTDATRDAGRFLASKALQGTTGVVNVSGADSGSARNLVVFGNPGGTGTPLLPGLNVGQVTISSDASNNVAISVNYPYQSLFGGSIPRFVGSGSISTGSMTLHAYTAVRAL
ncbi:MAG: pilus assembly protein [Proteobacteria bacterium]|nr:pilus assembly protein [Pseudomonadota bacterium]